LAAGAQLELFQAESLPVAKAVRLWRLGDDSVAAVVADWWEQWSDARAAMPVALKALERMLVPLRQRAESAKTNNSPHFIDSEIDQ
jgi:hypothetical protein